MKDTVITLIILVLLGIGLVMYFKPATKRDVENAKNELKQDIYDVEIKVDRNFERINNGFDTMNVKLNTINKNTNTIIKLIKK